ncbi:TetR/AcrR family transcriptional regulator [Streptomyces chryseus]|uniref:TetR family transcriptional regulator n=1 Tax=Streptomyces chryseus TaxID=68186 RepID=A0ABQ3EA23_9ACTN|nr:TetR family transcriptional regulator [Streptomyces chryseus]GGX02823.1 TetR family transcriptional regulator [Streptomyces chryseus]GHB28050.1 TetR family transcriptional regulator [Streptomyces chryseus]
MSDSSAPDAPPRRRSDATKAAILDAARERFAADGYERATIRAIARDAGIDPSMVMRYYGNKEGLFAAASAFDLRMPDVGTIAELGALPGRQVGAVLVEHFLDRWEADEVLTALLRVGVTNAAGAERMRAVFRDQLGPVAAGLSPDPGQAPSRAALVASQILGMAMARYVLRLPPAVEMTRQEVVDWLGPTVQRYLTAERP